MLPSFFEFGLMTFPIFVGKLLLNTVYVQVFLIDTSHPIVVFGTELSTPGTVEGPILTDLTFFFDK